METSSVLTTSSLVNLVLVRLISLPPLFSPPLLHLLHPLPLLPPPYIPFYHSSTSCLHLTLFQHSKSPSTFKNTRTHFSTVSNLSLRFFTTGNNWAKGTFTMTSFYRLDFAMDAGCESKKAAEIFLQNRLILHGEY